MKSISMILEKRPLKTKKLAATTDQKSHEWIALSPLRQGVKIIQKTFIPEEFTSKQLDNILELNVRSGYGPT